MAAFDFGNNWKQKTITALSSLLAYNLSIRGLLESAYFPIKLSGYPDMPESADSWCREQLKEVEISNIDTLTLKETPEFPIYAATNIPRGLHAHPVLVQELVQAIKDYAEQTELKERDPDNFDQKKLTLANTVLSTHRFIIHHEAGHLHKNHMTKRVTAYSSGLLTLPLFLKALGSISHNRWMSRLLLGFAHASALGIAINFYARSQEREADEFAIAHSPAEDLKAGAAYFDYLHKILASAPTFKSLLDSKAYESLDDLKNQNPWLFESIAYGIDPQHPASTHRAQRFLEAAAELEHTTNNSIPDSLDSVEVGNQPEQQA